MCGISAIAGCPWNTDQLKAMVDAQHHRGPDYQDIYVSDDMLIGLGHNRLSIIDLSSSGNQPMMDANGRLHIVFNGEIYNYLELQRELFEYPYQSKTDTEVILAAYLRWGVDCLHKFIGMFAFIIWDQENRTLFAARDRFGVKPLYYHLDRNGTLYCASEIKALHAAGLARVPNVSTWATYLAIGAYDHSSQTFWDGIRALPAGHTLVWHSGEAQICQWYDIRQRINDQDERPLAQIQEEYLALLEDSVRLRFRSDVPVGINLSGGLDSSTLLGIVHRIEQDQRSVKAYTFATGDPAYDETPWVQKMLERTQHQSIICMLEPDAVPDLAISVQVAQDEPFGGLPTLAYARLFEIARQQGTIVLLDGQGMDEQWAGYDYYAAVLTGMPASIVQGTKESPVRPECLRPDFRNKAIKPDYPRGFQNELLNAQYRDTYHTKIPRALRFNDRISMRSSTELREPFLDHRLFELALRQPTHHKIVGDKHKWFLRTLAAAYLPDPLVEAPKRALQTPQREWLRGPLREWSNSYIVAAAKAYPDWLDEEAVLKERDRYILGQSDNSFYVWQWISLGMMVSCDQ